MKVLLLGENGQLGWELIRTCPEGVELVTCDYPRVDFLVSASIEACIRESSPDWIINAAAYTAVDQAEEEKEKAFCINRDAVRQIAGLVDDTGAGLVHISTDYVFDGRNHRPWKLDDPTDPRSVYGRSKLEGEIAVREIMGQKSLIIRTAWLYSSHGKNFVKTMLHLMKTGRDLKVIDEQIGTPTWAWGLAGAIWTSIEKQLSGTFHWTDAGVASWYDFAVAVQEEACQLKLLKQSVSIEPVPCEQFPTVAERPFYSVLDKRSMWEKTGITPVHWRVQLRSMLREMIK